jgi:transcriptional regulator with XRE-family HTH domain
MDGAKLVYWMTKKNISMEFLAEKADVSKTHLSNLRTGKKEGSVSVWKRIAEVLEIELKELC